jgi:hypothetical protein
MQVPFLKITAKKQQSHLTFFIRFLSNITVSSSIVYYLQTLDAQEQNESLILISTIM